MSYPTLNDKTEALAQLSKGDHGAFNSLSPLHIHELDDLVQDVFEVIWTNRQSLHLVRSFHGYLRTIARYAAIDTSKKHGKRKKMFSNMGDFYSYHKQEDTAYVSAWTRGFFDFRSAGIYRIISELERWYDVKAYLHGPEPPGVYTFQASRKLKLENLLVLFEKAGVHFTLENGVLRLNK
jgi:DNA-directed RNA polymerase specialized sigma24 family protein